MEPKHIDRFFRALDKEFGRSATIILTGAAAGSLLGNVRVSQDVDFAIRPARRDANTWEELAAAIDRTMRQVGIEANYAEDIDRWSSITLLDYRRHTTLYRQFGRLRVVILNPVYWAIGKLARYLELDVQDLVTVLARHRVPLGRAVQLWGRALRESPKSAALTQFRRQVEHFLRTHGRTIWGRAFDAEAAVQRFHRHAGLRVPRSRT